MASGAPVHSTAFRVRRFLNWFPLGLAYAFLYMGRYNVTVLKGAVPDEVLSKADFGTMSAIGSWVYGFGFLVSGPLTDRLGGRNAMLIAVLGALAVNAAMGTMLYGGARLGWDVSLVVGFTALYAFNMFFQSFGAIAIVTTKAPWFHVSERGTFSTIFGTMISLGIYFAFDWGYAIVQATRATLAPELGVMATIFHAVLPLGSVGDDQNWWLFFTPAAILVVLWVVLLLFLRNNPGEAGYEDFDTGEASVSDDGRRLPVFQLLGKVLTHPVLLVICGIEFCSGIMRNGVMHWYRIYAKAVGETGTFVYANWGLCLLFAGIIGAFATGWASDRFFASRRAPMAGILYFLMLGAAIAMAIAMGGSAAVIAGGALVISMSVIGVHGIMSGTSTVDFGGSKNGGTVVGIVDGLVYLGTGLQFVVLGAITPVGEAAKDASEWRSWLLFLVPFALIGGLLSLRIWNEHPARRRAPVEPAAVGSDG